MIERAHPKLSVRQQCALLGLSRRGLYYRPVGESAQNLRFMGILDETYTQRPFYGVRKMTAHLRGAGHAVNPKRVRRLMRQMGLEAIYPRKRLSLAAEGHKRYPYLLRDLSIERPDQVWCADITYLRLRRGFLYLAAVMDWQSRYVLSWELSGSLEADFCLQALQEALRQGTPEIFNTDQGVQFTCEAFTGALETRGVRISMDGRGRCYDNIFVERLWRTVKYEEVFLRDYADASEARQGLKAYFRFYNELRPHQALDYRTPAQAYFAGHPARIREGSAASRTVAGTPVALRAPSVPATVGSSD
jgi:putative transposase